MEIALCDFFGLFFPLFSLSLVFKITSKFTGLIVHTVLYSRICDINYSSKPYPCPPPPHAVEQFVSHSQEGDLYLSCSFHKLPCRILNVLPFSFIFSFSSFFLLHFALFSLLLFHFPSKQHQHFPQLLTDSLFNTIVCKIQWWAEYFKR
jgi:hypothetical protein